jgi:hypothetical protein
MSHHLADLTPPELRAYARGLRNSTVIASLPAERPLDGRLYGEMQATVMLYGTLITACMREAELVEHFAARLEAAEAASPAEDEDDNPVVFWLAQDPEAGHFESAEDAVYTAPVLEPVEIASNGWPATRWAIREFISDDGDTQISWADTREEMMAYAADLLSPDPTPEEASQPGLADAVAESLADQTGAADPAQEAAPRDCEGAGAATSAPLASAPTRDDVKARAREMFLKGVPMPKIGALLGIPKTTINTWASKYGWREERDAGKGRPAGMPRAKPTPIAAVPDAMTTEDKAEARERLRTGKSKGARDIMDWFGCTQAEAQALVDEYRAGTGKAA